jgi:transforming growth factor-beta-induced protein
LIEQLQNQGGFDMKKILSLMMALTLLTFSFPSNADDHDIVDIAVGNPDFSILVTALGEAGLVEALQGDGPFTVFAPTDAAFAQLLADLNITAADLLGHPDLSKVLLYHVVSGKVMSTDLSDGMMPPTLNGNTIEIGTIGGVTVNQANVITADIEAANGVIHVIDSVIVPPDFMLEQPTMMEDKPDIVDIALSDPSFSMLVMLLQEAQLVGALQGDGPFTVFAPTNDAFVELVTALDITPEELMAQPGLADVLLYHVVSGKVMSTDLSDGLEAPTLNGDTIIFDLSSGVMADQANVTAADIEAANGVVHVIDSVLIPEGFALEEVDITEEDIPKTGDPSMIPLFAALMGSGLAVTIAKRKFK